MVKEMFLLVACVVLPCFVLCAVRTVGLTVSMYMYMYCMYNVVLEIIAGIKHCDF